MTPKSALLLLLAVSLPAHADNYWTQYTCTLTTPAADAPTVSIEADLDAQRALSVRVLTARSNDYIALTLVHVGSGIQAYQGDGAVAVLHDDVSLGARVYLTAGNLQYDCTHLAGAH
jgi:hypothetical protein